MKMLELKVKTRLNLVGLVVSPQLDPRDEVQPKREPTATEEQPNEEEAKV